MNKSAFVFPGQGSQTVGMLSDIAAQFKEVELTFKEASDVLGYDLWKLVQNGPAAQLDKTVHTQPALLAASYAIWRILQAKNQVTPAVLAGHSLGEYSALVCAKSISFADGIKLVAARGQFMQDAVPEGTGALAAVIGLDDTAVKELCDKVRETNEVLMPANFNCPGQVVISGHKSAVERAIAIAKDHGARLAMLLPVSVPSHCELMKPAAERLEKLMSEMTFNTPNIPVVNNVDVKVLLNPESIRDGLKRQLFMPVRWVETIQQFVGMGVTQIVECGPGKVLTGLIKRINPNLKLIVTTDLANLQNVTTTAN